jgi:hypothetical protein
MKDYSYYDDYEEDYKERHGLDKYYNPFKEKDLLYQEIDNIYEKKYLESTYDNNINYIKNEEYEPAYGFSKSAQAPVAKPITGKDVVERLEDEKRRRIKAEDRAEMAEGNLRRALEIANNHRQDQMQMQREYDHDIDKLQEELFKAEELVKEQMAYREKMRLRMRDLQEEVDRRRAEEAEIKRQKLEGPETFRGMAEQVRDVDLGE